MVTDVGPGPRPAVPPTGGTAVGTAVSAAVGAEVAPAPSPRVPPRPPLAEPRVQVGTEGAQAEVELAVLGPVRRRDGHAFTRDGIASTSPLAKFVWLPLWFL